MKKKLNRQSSSCQKLQRPFLLYSSLQEEMKKSYVMFQNIFLSSGEVLVFSTWLDDSGTKPGTNQLLHISLFFKQKTEESFKNFCVRFKTRVFFKNVQPFSFFMSFSTKQKKTALKKLKRGQH